MLRCPGLGIGCQGSPLRAASECLCVVAPTFLGKRAEYAQAQSKGRLTCCELAFDLLGSEGRPQQRQEDPSQGRRLVGGVRNHQRPCGRFVGMMSDLHRLHERTRRPAQRHLTYGLSQ